MNVSELIAGLRECADRLEANAEALEGARITASVSCHADSNRDLLRAIARTMDRPRPMSYMGTHWISGRAGVEIIAYYKAGLLGRTKNVEVVKQESAPDLAGLLAE